MEIPVGNGRVFTSFSWVSRTMRDIGVYVIDNFGGVVFQPENIRFDDARIEASTVFGELSISLRRDGIAELTMGVRQICG